MVWIALGMLTPSMIADTIDDDELKNGSRREGMFGAIYSFVTKLGFSLAFSLSFVTLSMTGFDEALGGMQSADTIWRMRLILSVAPVVFAVLGIWILSAYPLTKKRHAEIRAKLEKRRGSIG